MSYNPANTKWTVSVFDNDGKVTPFDAPAWEFHQASMTCGTLWSGAYRPIPGSDNRFVCEIVKGGTANVWDNFEIIFVTDKNFVATKDGACYRFGKRQ